MNMLISAIVISLTLHWGVLSIQWMVQAKAQSIAPITVEIWEGVKASTGYLPRKQARDKPKPTLAQEEAEFSKPKGTSSPGVRGSVGAEILSAIKPQYPPLSRQRGEEGIVEMEILLGKSGTVSEYKIIKGSGFSRLDRAAAEAILRGQFTHVSGLSLADLKRTVSIEFRLVD